MATALSTASPGGDYFGSPTYDGPLPWEAAEKLRDLRQQAADASAIVRAATEAARMAREERARVEVEFQAIQRSPQGVAMRMRQPTLPPGSKATQAVAVDDAPIRHAKARLDRAVEAVERAAQVVAEREALWNVLGQLVTNIDTYLRKLPEHIDLVAYPPQALPLLKRNEKPADVINKTRQDIAKLSADLRRVQSAPLPSTLAKVMAREQIGELMRNGQPDVANLVASGQPLRFAQTWRTPGDGRSWPELDAVALLAWLNPDTFIEKVELEIDRVSDDAHALAPDDRQEKARKIAADLLSLERLEEAAILQSESDGVTLLRRPAASPLAVLQLADIGGGDDDV